MLVNIVFIGCSYLFGSLPFATALARISGLDVYREGDLHSALWYKVSKFRGSLAGFVDCVKGCIPVLVGFGFNLTIAAVALSGAASVAGQMWPPFRRDNGEKGNSIGVGVIITLALTYQAYFILLSLIFFAVGAASKYFWELSGQPDSSAHPRALALPLGMLLGFASAPAASWCSGQANAMSSGLLVLFIIIVMRRLTTGLKADLQMSNSITRMLVNRFLFDQSLMGKTSQSPSASDSTQNKVS